MSDDHISSEDELSATHVLALTEAYRRTLEYLGYSPIAYPDTSERCGTNKRAGVKFACLNHAYWMCGRIKNFAEWDRMGKALRWLGTVQGMLIMAGVFSIDEIMAHDRTTPNAAEIARRAGEDA
jgi:hypothetical protein